MPPIEAASDSGSLSTLLLLVDGRFPSGGHAHSGGMEATSSLEDVADVTSMEQFLIGRLHTVGVVAAAFAAAACATFSRSHGSSDGSASMPPRLDGLDRELDARTPSPAVRAASRRLGRQVLRAGRLIWPHPDLDAIAAVGTGPHHSIGLGAVAAAAGLGPEAAAHVAAHDAVVSAATAALRLLGLDPFAVHATLARLAPDVDTVAAKGAAHAHIPPAGLPSLTAPLLDIAAEWHTTWEARLFAS